MQLGSMFICNCNIALHVSDAFCVHLQEHLDLGRLVGYLRPSVSNINVHTLHLPKLFWYASITINVALYYIVTYPVTLVHPVYTPVYVSFISCSMSRTRGCFYSF